MFAEPDFADQFTVATLAVDYNLAASRIQQIFAKTYDSYQWNVEAARFEWIVRGVSGGKAGGYERLSADGFDVTETGANGVAPTSPLVFAVGVCDGTACRAGLANSVTVNGQEFGNVAGERGQLRAYLRFFAHANSNQMPIRKVLIEWGDGTARSGSNAEDNYYKNHNGISDPNPATGWRGNLNPCNSTTDFGDSPAACDSSPFQFNHTYRCTNPDAKPSCSATRATDCKRSVDGRNVCVFVPRVFVKDNWGWCASESSAGCPGAPGGSGCYDGDENETLESINQVDECNPNDFSRLDSTKNPWVYFNGEIQIAP